MENILLSMRDRMPWSVASTILKSIGVSPSQGWQKTIDKLKSQELFEFEGPLLDAIEEHNLCGEKFTKIYDVGSDTRKALQDHVLSMEPEDGFLKQAYPLSVLPSDIEKVGGEPKLVSVIGNDDGVGAVFSSSIFITKREKISVYELEDDPSGLRERFDELIGLKHQLVQMFNVLWMPHEGRYIEIRTDLPDGMPMDVAQNVQSTLRKTVNRLGKTDLDHPVDLYPVLASIYDDDKEGQVVELGFSTTSASVKHERMRKAGLDLRSEPYHLAGKAGLGTPIEPFRLSVVWYLPRGEHRAKPELSLVGTARGRTTADNNAVEISGAIIRNCAGRGEYEHVIERIRHHLDRS